LGTNAGILDWIYKAKTELTPAKICSIHTQVPTPPIILFALSICLSTRVPVISCDPHKICVGVTAGHSQSEGDFVSQVD